MTPASLPASTTTVAQTDSVIPASNPANVPILKESKKVNKPVAVSYDGRHGGVYEGDKIEQGVEMSPLGRKQDLEKNAKRGVWSMSSRNGIRAFAEMWNALAEYDR